MLTSDGTAIHGRRFQEDGLCFCSLESLADRAPTENEFAAKYNETVMEMDLPNVQYVVSVHEQDDDIEYHVEVVSIPDNIPMPAPSENAVEPPQPTLAKEMPAPMEIAGGGALEVTASPICKPT